MRWDRYDTWCATGFDGKRCLRCFLHLKLQEDGLREGPVHPQCPVTSRDCIGGGDKEERTKEETGRESHHIQRLSQVTLSLFHIYFLAMLRKRKIDTLISPAHFPGPSGAEAEMTYHCEEGEDVTAFTNSCGRKIIILKVCGLYKPYLLSQTTRKLISDTKHLILSNQ